jgi:glycosyltransferase involved in cell wall biosynthesis
MKISLFDSWNGKFSNSFREHWESLGHEVMFNPTLENARTADMQFFYQADNVLIEATKVWNLPGTVFAQCVDIEVWAGQPYAVDWNKVSGCIFMAEHIEEMVKRNVIFQCPTKIIKPGINLDKYTLRPPNKFSEPIRRIAYVVGDRRIWDVKRFDIALQILRDLMWMQPKFIWQLHVRGTYSSHEQYNDYCRHLEKDLGLENNVVWYEDRVEDMNLWLDDKDFFLLPSTKEAFSYATGEAMAKGIKPIIGNWRGSKQTWGKYVCETYGQMLVEITRGEYKPEEYRKFVEDNYDEKKYLLEIDKFLGL